MKTSLKRWLALLMVLTLLFALAPAALAEEGDDPEGGSDPIAQSDTETKTETDPIKVSFKEYPKTVKVGALGAKIVAAVEGAGDGAEYAWKSSAPEILAVKDNGSGTTATLTPLGAGEATVTLTVRSGDSQGETSVKITVEAENVNVTVEIQPYHQPIKVGERFQLSAIVTGADENAEYIWESTDSAILDVEGSKETATVYAVGPGKANISLNVYRKDDHGKGMDIIYLEVNEPEPEPQPDPLTVNIPPYTLPIEVGQSVQINAIVTGGGSELQYNWFSSDPDVLTVSGSETAATLTAVGAGDATITLTVSRTIPDRRAMEEASDYIPVSVKAARTPVTVAVNGANTITMDVGDEAQLSASISGGSGSYDLSWTSDLGAGIYIDATGQAPGNAKVFAGKGGQGTVSLTVTDKTDPGNYATASWSVTANEAKKIDRPVATLSQSRIDMSPGGTAALTMSVTGGSGNFEYIWRTDSTGIVSIEGSGSAVTLRATDTLLPNANAAEVFALVRDLDTDQSSDLISCVVTVVGGSVSYNASASGRAGSAIDLGTVAGSINDAFVRSFGKVIGDGASIKFSSTNGTPGSIRLSDGTAVQADHSYTFNTFYTMVFNAAAGGSFSTYYLVTDGGNSITGTLTVSVDGALPVTSVAMNPTSLKLATNSNQYLTVTAAPANAPFSVSWSVDNSQLLTLAGSGAKITLKSGNRTGTAKVTATVSDGTGKLFTCSCTVTVYEDSPYVPFASYDPSITIMLGSDYYGSKVADSMSSRFRSEFGVYPGATATIIFPKLGDARYGTMRLKNGTPVVERRSYNFRDFVDMYYTPDAAGTAAFSYQLNYNDQILQGTMYVVVEASSLTVNMDPSAIIMAPYSTQAISLSVSPASAYYRVSWATSDKKVATVSGSNSSATVTSAGTGTAVIYATVTDNRGVETRRGCTVVVTDSGSTFNPTVSTMLGTPYVGTGASGAMRSQFQSLYNMTLADNAIIRFASTGNTEVGVMRLSDGSMIRPNTDYTLGQFVSMYTQPVTAGVSSVPYKLTYAGKTLNGTVSVNIGSASISTNLTLPSRTACWFSDALSGTTGGTLFSDSIRNAAGSGWGYIRFGSTSDGTGTLYLDRNYTPLSQSVNVTPAALSQLLFVPGAQNGTFSAPYTVYTATGGVMATGTLNISAQGISFSDVPAGAFYAPAVDWAVGRGVTSGTGGSSFSPDMTVTRGQAVTFLWRAAGQPKSSVTVNPFTDVIPGAYYYDAVLWAVQQGITLGTSDTTFSPDLPLHRDQLLTFLCRANGGYAGGDDWSNLAVGWANARGLLTGLPINFVAAGDCPRSEVVYYLWRNYNG